ncbi:MAG TPA: hypothetical protein VHV75_17135 [Solirubrobacteraceae bacterium]|jgi:hypothetical protein|nr:hypothetical protein [Solirubrobacteraceae bacterium]
MGLFKNMNDLYKAGGEPMGKGRHAQRSEKLANAQSKMSAAREMLAQQTRMMNLAATGTDASATIIDARQTTQMINFEPVVELDLHLVVEGGAPYPLTVSQPVPQLYLAKAQAGGTLKAKIDLADPSAVFLDFARS